MPETVTIAAALSSLGALLGGLAAGWAARARQVVAPSTRPPVDTPSNQGTGEFLSPGEQARIFRRVDKMCERSENRDDARDREITHALLKVAGALEEQQHGKGGT